MQALGYNVRHPIGTEVVLTPEGHRAHEPGVAVEPLHGVEVHYYGCIRDCDFHCVANTTPEQPGYTGDSAAIEIGYAMMHGKPIVLTDPLYIAPHVNPPLRRMIEANADQFHVWKLGASLAASYRPHEEGFLGDVRYALSFEDELHLMRLIGGLFAALEAPR